MELQHPEAASPESGTNGGDHDRGSVKQTEAFFFPGLGVSKTKHWQPTSPRHRCLHDTERGAALCGLPVWGALETLIFGRGLGATAGLNQTR